LMRRAVLLTYNPRCQRAISRRRRSTERHGEEILASTCGSAANA
jgi:hypothetical protein